MIDCAICNAVLLQVKDLANICVATCGHTFHSSCLNLNTKRKIKCPVRSCKKTIKADTVIQVRPFVQKAQQPGCSTVGQDSLQIDDQYIQIMCTICNDPMTDPENISVIRCGHTFHFNCATEWVKLKSKPVKCSVTSCNENFIQNGIIQMLPIDRENNHEKHGRGAKKEAPVWESVFKLIQEKFQDPNMTISEEEALDLRKKIEILKTTDNGNLLQIEDKLSKAGLQAPFIMGSSMQRLHWCQNCEKKEKKIQSFKTRMTNVKKQKARYCRENQYLKEQKKMAMTEGRMSISYLRETNSQKIVELEELRQKNETLQQTIQTLESNVATSVADLRDANSQISDLNKLKDNYEGMQQEMQTLQSQVITAREANFRDVAEIRELRSRNEHLTEQNELMKRDISKLTEDFASQDATITDFMVNELQMRLQNDNLVQNLYEQINTLQESNNRLRMFNADLQKENDYRWELLMNIRSNAGLPEVTKMDM